MAKLKKATFAGGCFWCMQPPFEKLEGVKKVLCGYTGGEKPAPTYREVCSGGTGHLEAVEVTYDPEVTDYDRLLDVFWRQIDPTDPGGQFADRGEQYRPAIFYHDDTQKKKAESSKKALDSSGKFDKPVVTEVRPAKEFYEAEEDHQDYSNKCPVRYTMYKAGSGRDDFIKRVWEDSGKGE